MRSFSFLWLLLGSALLGLTIPNLAISADDGAKIFNEVCLSCHSPSVRPLDEKHLTRDEWKEAVDKMIGLGVEVPKGKIPELLDYLVRTHGPKG